MSSSLLIAEVVLVAELWMSAMLYEVLTVKINWMIDTCNGNSGLACLVYTARHRVVSYATIVSQHKAT